MRHGPDFKIVGASTLDSQHNVLRELESAFYDHKASLDPAHRRQLEQLEYPFSAVEQALFDFANTVSNEFLVKAGEAPFDVPRKNIAMLPTEALGGRDSRATTHISKQAITFNARRTRANPVSFGSTLFHEFLHLKAPVTVEVVDRRGKKEPLKKIVRTGISIMPSTASTEKYGDTEYFDGVHEALIVIAQMGIHNRMLELPVLSRERKWMRSEKFREYARKIAIEQLKVPTEWVDYFVNYEFQWISEDGQEFESFSYQRARQTYQYVCEQIREQFGAERFPDWLVVHEEFLKAQLSRKNLLTVARLVEETFGKGSFRTLGLMKKEDDSATAVLKVMQAARRKFLKDAKIGEKTS